MESRSVWGPGDSAAATITIACSWGGGTYTCMYRADLSSALFPVCECLNDRFGGLARRRVRRSAWFPATSDIWWLQGRISKAMPSNPPFCGGPIRFSAGIRNPQSGHGWELGDMGFPLTLETIALGLIKAYWRRSWLLLLLRYSRSLYEFNLFSPQTSSSQIHLILS